MNNLWPSKVSIKRETFRRIKRLRLLKIQTEQKGDFKIYLFNSNFSKYSNYKIKFWFNIVAEVKNPKNSCFTVYLNTFLCNS